MPPVCCSFLMIYGILSTDLDWNGAKRDIGDGLITFPDWLTSVNQVVFASVLTLLSCLKQELVVSWQL